MSDAIQILRGRWVLQDPETLLADTALVVVDDRIDRVGPWDQIRESYPEAPVIGSEQHALVPGLINAHHHSNGVTALQHGIPDRLLELWLLTLAQRRHTDLYLTTLLSAARLLRTGVTAVVDVHGGRGTPAAFENGVRQALRAYDEAGLRVAFAVGMTEQSYFVWGEDEAFLASLPPAARSVAEKRLPKEGAITADDCLELTTQLCREYQSHPRLSLWYGPPGPQWVSDDLLVRIAAQAETVDAGIQTHLLESFYEKHHGPRSYGQSTVAHLRDLGILSPRFSCAHGVWLSEADIEILARHGVHVSHNPSSNLRLRAGVAPLNALLSAGVNVGLGMDGTTLNDDEDMFTEMRLALNLHRPPQLGSPAPTVADIWRLATTGGARLFQAGSQIGRLAPGYAADVVLLRLDRITWPWVAPEADPRLLILTRARARDVDTVLVDGQVVLRHGVPTRVDVPAAGEALADSLARTPRSDEAAQMVQVLLPHVEAHYRNWSPQDPEPYAHYNSRR